MKKALLFILSLLVINTLTAQTVFVETLGSPQHEFAGGIIEAANGDFVMVGHTDFTGDIDSDALLIRTDSLGNVAFVKTYGTPEVEHALDIFEAPNGDFFITGYTNSTLSGEDAYLMKVSATGSLRWVRSYGGSGNDRTRNILPDGQGGFFLSGHSGSFGQGDLDLYFLHVDSLGTVLNSSTFGGPDEDRCRSMAFASDGNILLSGWTQSFGAGKKDMCLVKVDASGNRIFDRTYGLSRTERGQSLGVFDNGDIIIGGWSRDNGSTVKNPHLLRLDSTGAVQWFQLYEGNYSGRWNELLPAPNGDIIAMGYGNRSASNDTSDLYLMRANGAGSPQWARRFGRQGDDAYPRITAHQDTGWTIATHTNSLRPDSIHDIYLIKTNFEGYSGCDVVVQSYSLTTATPQVSNNVFTQGSGGQAQQITFLEREQTFVKDTLCLGASREDLRFPTTAVNLYPNPAHTSLQVELLDLPQGRVLTRLIDSQGKTLQTDEFRSGTTHFEVSRNNLPAGLYVLEIQIGAKRVAKRLIFQ